MTSPILTLILWTAALGSGLMAGIYFAFSTFIMRAFASLEPAQAVAAMNAINSGILRSLFMPLFFGTSLLSLALMVAGALKWGEPGAGWLLLAGFIYLLGMFLCTALFNVPLNNALAAVEPHSAASGPALAPVSENLDRLEPPTHPRLAADHGHQRLAALAPRLWLGRQRTLREE